MAGDQTVNVRVNAIGNFSNLTGEINKFKSQLQGLKLPKDIMSSVEKAMDNVSEKANKFQTLLSKGINSKGDYSRLVSGAKEYESAVNHLDKTLDKIGNKEIKAAVLNSSEVKQAEQELEKLLKKEREIANFGKAKEGIISEAEIAKVQKLIGSTEGLKKKFNDVSKAFKMGDVEQAQVAVKKLVSHIEQYQSRLNTTKSPERGDNLLKWAKDLDTYLTNATSDVHKFQASFNQLQTNKFKQIGNDVSNFSTKLKAALNDSKQFVNMQTQSAQGTLQMSEQVSHLRTQANYFFGLQNMGRLVSRGIREAAESVRDLDKAMTETAVVTDKSVGDLWNDLPKYTALANKLGATTQGAYETMTLYFQQGLDDKATFEIGEETMKMARIAGLDYADTTNMMTAALRGFNMELNQTSAKRVNDVYSELAAITASDTRELGLAMERTASIAHSAGMDFGNVSAFLAQMIETTREAPENLGTAMKTIVARFQELKENPYSISEVEGEEVDFNRVDKALKSIGVDLMDNKDKFRDLDDVFMDISERWDGLSQTQQRYVATIAAGARQQSRFLAMVQNYDRLKQLTDAAANSEGASDVQFNKTLESYEAKMNKLKNAWQAFTMSLANNHAIKGGIDILKDIITFGNKIIQTFGSVGKIFGETGKGIAEMGAAFGLGALGFKTLKGGANLGLRMLGGMTVKGAAMDGGMFPGGMTSKGSIGLASRISNPIVSAINKLTAVVSKESVDTGFRNKLVQEKRGDLYNKVRQSEVIPKIPETKLEQALSKGNVYYKKSYLPFSAKDIQSEFKNLNKLEQQQLYKSIPSIRNALQDGYTKAYKGLKIDKAGEAALTTHFRKIDQAVQSGKISAADAFKHLYNPQSVAQAIDNPEVTKALNTALQKQMKSWSPEKERSMGQKLKYLADKKGLEGEARGQFYRDAKQRFAGKELREVFSEKQTAQLGKIAGAMSKVSGVAAQAGQSVMGLGMMLDSLGMHGVGAAVMTIGNGLVGLGMAAEGAVGAVKALKTAFTALNAINPMLAGLGAIAAIGAVTVGAVTAINKKIVKDTRETGDRVVKAYTKTKEKTIEQLDNLKKYRENWEVWSAGVDEYGNNINLGTEEYQEYLKAVKDITNAHPELIKGYNALGNAYIDNNTALKKAADLIKKDEKDALNTYLNSYDEIVAKQKTYKRWVNAMSSGGKNAQNTTAMANTKGAAGRTVNASSASNMVDQANAVVESIQKISDSEKILKDFNIELDSTGKLTETGLENLRTHLQDVTNTVKNSDLAPSKETQEQFDNMTEAANTYAKTVQGLEKVSEDTYDWGWTYASKKGYDKIDSNLIVPFQTSIKRLAEQGLSQSEMTSNIDALGSKYQNLGGYLEDFKKIQDKVNEAAITLGEDANFDAYTDKVENLTAPIDAWVGSLRDAGGQSNQILAEFFENQVAVMLDYQTQASEILSQGLNQDQNLFISASQASEKYQKRKEEIVDYSSGIQDAKEILDDAMTSINLEGEGSLTFEQAAISIVGEDFVDRNVDNIDKVKNKMKEYQGWLQDSEGNAHSLEDTYTSFWDHITQKAMESPDKTIEGIDGKLSEFFVETENDFEMNAEKWSSLTDEQMGLLAEKGFDMSSDFMASMLNIGRQLGYYSSADPSKIRQGLVQQEGQGTAVSQTSGRVYKKESDFEEESRLAQNSKSETAELKKEAKNQNVVLLDEAKNLSKSTVKQMMDDFGVSGKNAGKKFAETFSDIGYDKEGVDAALATALKNENLDEGTRKSLEDYRTNLDANWAKLLEDKSLDFDTEDGTIESIDAHTASIDANMASMLAKEGALDKNAYGYDKDDPHGLKSGKGYDALAYVLGDKGRDTKAQYFASGKDAEGNKLSESTYREWQGQLQNRLSEYQTQAALAKTNAQNATGEDKTWWENQAKSYESAVNYLQDYITKGQQAHNEKKAQNEEDEVSNDEKTRKKTENDQKETESDQAKTESESQNKQKLSNEYLKYLDSFNQMQTGEGQPTLLTPEQLAQKMGVMTPDEISDYKAKYQELKQLQASSGQVEPGNANDIIGNASNLDSTIQKLQQTGTIGAQSADAIKRSFIDANINGIAKMDGSQLASLQSALGVTEEELQQIAKEHNITINTEDQAVDDTTKKISEIEKHPPVKVPVTVGGNEDGDKKGGVLGKLKDWFKDKLTIDTDDSKVESTQKKVADLAQQTNKGAKFKISVPGLGSLTKAAKAYKAFGSGGTKKASVGLDSSKVSSGIDTAKNKVSSFKNASAKAAIGIKDNASSVITSIKNKLNSLDGKKASTSVSVNVSANYTGPWKKTVYIKEEKIHTGGFVTSSGVTYRAQGGTIAIPRFKKKGTDTVPAMLTPGEYVQNRGAVNYFGVDFMRKINHKDLSGALQTLGSAANGRYGRLGPKGKGGLTLTGEEGFEVAWIPGENRSMILGANGPQMIDLPSDAVVWNNKQSKKILKDPGKAGIPAGSMRSGGAPTKKTTSSGSSGGGRSSGSRGGSGNSGKGSGNNSNKKNNKAQTKIIQKAGKINEWWWNMTKKVEATQRKIDKLAKTLESTFKRFGKTIGSIDKDATSYRTELKRQISLNTTMFNKAKSTLNTIDKGNKKVTNKVKKEDKKVAKAQKKYDKAKSDKAKKAAKKELDKAKKKRDKAKTGANYATISYDVTQKTKKKGEKKRTSKKVTKKARINLAPYIYQDKKTGAYQIDWEKINKDIGKKNGSKAKAVGEAAKKKLEDYQGKKNTAEDNITKPREALEKLNNDIYATFYDWEKSITKVYLLSQKLEEITKRISITGSRAELQFAKLNAGIEVTSKEGLEKIRGILNEERDLMLLQTQASQFSVDAATKEFADSLNFKTYLDKYSPNTGSTDAQDDYKAAQKAFDLLDKANMDVNNFNYNDAISLLSSQKYNEETYNKVKEVLDKIFEKQGQYLDAIEEGYQTQTAIYEKMEEMQSYIAEFETDLISGLEEQAEDEISKLEKINSSLSKAYKDLLDEIKRKLDERRKQEDNAKTESDISKKRQRLAALRADTAGGNQVEIARLEKEIAEAQQNYQRSLEDQLIERLRAQGEEAEKQRQRQIDLLEAQKEIAKETGTNIEEVRKWLESDASIEQYKEQIRQAWLANQNYDEAAPKEQEKLEGKFEEAWTKYLAYKTALPEYETTVKELLPKIENDLNEIADNILKISGDRTTKTMKAAGATAKQLFKGGYSAKSLKNAEYTTKQIAEAGYTKKQLSEGGIGLSAIQNWNKKNPKNKISGKALRSAEYSAKNLANAGYTDKEIRQAGYTIKQFKAYKGGGKAGAKAAKSAGYTDKAIAKTYGAANAMIGANISGAAAQAGSGKSAKDLQEIVNKSKKDAAQQKDMANVKVGTVDVNGKAKGGKVKGAHLSATLDKKKGSTVGVNKGSTLYTKDWIEKTGKVASGKWKSITIDKLTVALLKKYPIDAKQALESAIKNKKPGSKINKNMKGLITQAKIAGKTYKLKNGITASIGSNGKIYYNDGKKGVRIWDAGAGKLSLEKYNLKTFKKKADNKKSTIWREYANVLRANKVKGYATGGLADFTGPAWLDGTPTKPELVLNAQDTKNFLALKDVLSHSMSSANSAPAAYGDTNVEVNINVDHISNDYDVDRLVQRVKKDITKDMGYRNVTQVRNFK